MSDTIEPVLTPDEWKHAQVHHAGLLVTAYAALGELAVVSESGEHVALSSDQLPGVMAAANDALQYDSPYKITRGDVHAVQGAVGIYARFRSALPNIDDAELQNGVRSLVRDDLDRPAQKLAALLPPA